MNTPKPINQYLVRLNPKKSGGYHFWIIEIYLVNDPETDFTQPVSSYSLTKTDRESMLPESLIAEQETNVSAEEFITWDVPSGLLPIIRKDISDFPKRRT